MPRKADLCMLVFLTILHDGLSVVCPTSRRFRELNETNPRTGSRFPNVLLYSYEGSGNTWTRSLLEEATGIWSGAVYSDTSLREMGFKGEGKQDASVIVVKSHILMVPSFQNYRLQAYNKTVQLLRNPFNSLVAERKRLVVRHNFHRANPDWTTFNNGITWPRSDRYRRSAALNWDAWMDAGMRRWNTTLKYAAEKLSLRTPIFNVRFEDLVESTQQTMRGVLEFLGTCLRGSHCSLATAVKFLALLHSDAA